MLKIIKNRQTSIYNTINPESTNPEVFCLFWSQSKAFKRKDSEFKIGCWHARNTIHILVNKKYSKLPEFMMHLNVTFINLSCTKRTNIGYDSFLVIRTGFSMFPQSQICFIVTKRTILISKIFIHVGLSYMTFPKLLKDFSWLINWIKPLIEWKHANQIVSLAFDNKIVNLF